MPVKIGIISDIHANLAALQAVLPVLQERGCGRILCAGDVVGYGPCPTECLDLVVARKILCVQGNHDAAACSTRLEISMNDDAQAAVGWTRSQLSPDAAAWLRQLPLEADYAGIRILHASHAWRPRWAYVLDPNAAAVNFLFQSCLYAFHGHSHVPMMACHERGTRVYVRNLSSMELPRHARLLINVGSVGQPRDGNPAAACAVYDTRDRRLDFMRVPYHVAATQALMAKAGLPERLIQRLARGN